VADCVPAAGGAKVMLMEQVEFTGTVEQLLVWVKLLFTASGMVMLETVRVCVPLLLRDTVWGTEVVPTALAAKVNEFGETLAPAMPPVPLIDVTTLSRL
jgi:hypothetical protein